MVVYQIVYARDQQSRVNHEQTYAMTPIIPIMTIVNFTPKIESSKEKSLEKRQEKQNQVKKQQASRKAEKRNEQRSPGLGSIKGEAQRKTHNNAQHKKSKRKHNRRKK